MIDAVDEEGEAYDVGEENELLEVRLATRLSNECYTRSFAPRVDEGTHTCRTSVHVCPTCVRNCIPAIHSSKLSRVSRAKSCRCETSRSITYFSRGSAHCEFIRCTFSVMFSIVKSLRTGTVESPLLVEGAMPGGWQAVLRRKRVWHVWT